MRFLCTMCFVVIMVCTCPGVFDWWPYFMQMVSGWLYFVQVLSWVSYSIQMFWYHHMNHHETLEYTKMTYAKWRLLFSKRNNPWRTSSITKTRVNRSIITFVNIHLFMMTFCLFVRSFVFFFLFFLAVFFLLIYFLSKNKKTRLTDWTAASWWPWKWPAS